MNNVIEFPSARRARPLSDDELPVDWSEEVRMRYWHMTYRGTYAHADAFRLCMGEHEERRRAGESEGDALRRQARAAFARAAAKLEG